MPVSLRVRRWLPFLTMTVVMLGVLAGCASETTPPAEVPGPPTVRVLLDSDVSSATLEVDGTVHAATNQQNLPLKLQGEYTLKSTDGGWLIGTEFIAGTARLRLTPDADVLIAINGDQFPGTFDCVRQDGLSFDVVNVVTLEEYLVGVVAGEMFNTWHLDALKAQVVAARTYALFQMQTLDRGYFDLYGDTRDQAYVPIAKRTDNDRKAVDETTGVVLAWGAEGKPRRIFKAYYSSTSGGPSIGAVDAFGDSPVNRVGPINTPVNYGDLDRESSRYAWTIETTKSEFDAAVKSWARSHDHPAAGLGTIDDVRVDARNSLHRPIRYVVIDRAGKTATIGAEPMRSLLGRVGKSWGNWVEPTVKGKAIVFNGHGFGHGVGMSQYGAEGLAKRGTSWDRILQFCYPGAELVRAYAPE